MPLEIRNWIIDPWEDWSQIGPGFNWRTFHLILAEIEDDRMLGSIEASIAVLGLGLRVRWTYNTDTEYHRELTKRVSEVTREK